MIPTLIKIIDRLYPWTPRVRSGITKRLAYKLRIRLLMGYQRILLVEEGMRRHLNIGGVTQQKRKTPLLVCLTSFQARFFLAHLALASLMRQSVKPDRLILYLHRSELSSLPPRILALKKRGLEIIALDETNLLGYKKIIPPLRAYPDALIVTADDDLIYERTWLARLYRAYQREPQYVHCHRAHRLTRNNAGQLKRFLDWDLTSPGCQGPGSDLLPTNGAGTLLRSSLLSRDVFNQDVFLKHAPYADDVWIYGMIRKKGTFVKKIAPHSTPLYDVYVNASTPLGAIAALSKKNFLEGTQNDKQLDAVLRHYDLFDAVFRHPSSHK